MGCHKPVVAILCRITIWGESTSGLRHYSENWKVPSANHARYLETRVMKLQNLHVLIKEKSL